MVRVERRDIQSRAPPGLIETFFDRRRASGDRKMIFFVLHSDGGRFTAYYWREGGKELQADKQNRQEIDCRQHTKRRSGCVNRAPVLSFPERPSSSAAVKTNISPIKAKEEKYGRLRKSSQFFFAMGPEQSTPMEKTTTQSLDLAASK